MDFNYKKICQDLIKDLPQRTKEVIERRFGLVSGERETLEAIGQSFGITRERVRQIGEEGFSKIAPKTKKYEEVFQYFVDYLKSSGDVKREDHLLAGLGGKNYQNQVLFLITLAGGFQKSFDDFDLHSFWTANKNASENAKKAIALVMKKFQEEQKPLSLDKLYGVQKSELDKIFGNKINKAVFASFLDISKKIQKNPDGEYGMKNWLEINPRGIKDKAYLVLKKEGKPLHFTNVASNIEKLPYALQRKVHLATVHNELIKDQRFVLIGRGIYALKEWGYEPGLVKDVIYKVLKDSEKPMTREEILAKVSKQRMVKENTVFLNLQDRNTFVRNPDGRYQIGQNKISEA